MNILAIDTTSEWGSLAVRSSGALVAEVHLESPDGFAHVLFSAITEILKQAGLQLDAIDCFAAANGPGSFTGVRVGLAAVKGLAEALGKSAAGISNLRAAAVAGNAAQRAVILDARRGEVFAAVYDAAGRAIVPEVVTNLSAWLHSLPEGIDEFVLPVAASFRESIAQGRWSATPLIDAPRHLAPAIAYCAEIDGQKSGWPDAASLDANYVRRSDAELFWQEA